MPSQPQIRTGAEGVQKNTTGLARDIRATCVEMVHRAKASHIGSALSMADVVAVLYGQVLDYSPSEPDRASRDRLILSKGHACVGIYAALGHCGFFPLDALKAYGDDFSEFMNHISHKVPGVEFSTGSLGHGLPFGTGRALAASRRGEDWRVFVILGDGELGEGSNWEAMMFAAHHRLDNLVAVIDYNNLQSLTTVAETLGIEPLEDKFRAFGWAVRTVDGHDHAALAATLGAVPLEKGKPTAVIARTVKGKGVSFMENSVAWHYKSPNDEQLAQALAELRAGDA